MFDTLPAVRKAPLPNPATCPVLARARAVLDIHGAALVTTAGWLGGPADARDARAVLHDIAGASRWTRSLDRRLARLAALLRLDFSNDPCHPSAAVVAGFDPADPRFDDLMRLSETMSGLLAGSGINGPR